ncbi:radical SAM protein [Microcoleus sp. LEGE 07076]|uniref:B12-binding domain-containing radical SAM protein n=1 Tax=Microcoleus sp. LEGE 07076 TaxID=915322 RepID=UPI001880ACC0|nr:radical SAM protein [Microcoleus sp. LEGE 07076]MBE9183861.1 radical SAM protein [Microcoleus sp. LEGE 07076]
MKVALINPPASRIIYGNEYKLKSIIPCLGLFYLQSYCKDIADIEIFEGEFYSDLEHFINAIKAFNPDIIGITSNTSTYPLCVQIAESVDAKVKAVGGPYSSFRVSESLETFDVVFIGDSEVSFRMLLERQPLETIPSIAFKEPTGAVVRTDNACLPPLDSIPFPDHSKIQLGLYQASPHRKLQEPFATMITTRGCGFKCSFCLSAKGGMNDGKYRERSVANVVQELELLTTEFGVKSVQFWDDTFTMRRDRTKELCSEIKKLGIEFVCNTRTDKIDSEIANWLADAGCRGVFFGVESGDQYILDLDMHKGAKNEQVKNAIEYCKETGMWSTASFIFGSINDTEESIQDTVNFAVELDADYVLFNIYTAHPGTYGYMEALRQSIIDEYKVDLERWLDEPVGIPTICKNLSRQQLHKLKAEAYVKYYTHRGADKYRDIIKTYQEEILRLSNALA